MDKSNISKHKKDSSQKFVQADQSYNSSYVNLGNLNGINGEFVMTETSLCSQEMGDSVKDLEFYKNLGK